MLELLFLVGSFGVFKAGTRFRSFMPVRGTIGQWRVLDLDERLLSRDVAG